MMIAISPKFVGVKNATMERIKNAWKNGELGNSRKEDKTKYSGITRLRRHANNRRFLLCVIEGFENMTGATHASEQI